MKEHSVFYYPYASFRDENLPLLKAAALYFDKIYILDPTKAHSDSIGATPGIEDEINLLQKEGRGFIERIDPTEVFDQTSEASLPKSLEDAIVESINADMADPEFHQLCDSKTDRSHWRIALAKIPPSLRSDERFSKKEDAMRNIMRSYVEYREGPYSSGTEYRIGECNLSAGESIMINHAIYTGLLHRNATPITDDLFHKEVLEYKLQRAIQDPEIIASVGELSKEDRIKQDLLAKETLTDLDLAIVNPKLPMEKILEYKYDNEKSLELVREELRQLAEEIRTKPFTKEFAAELGSNTLRKVRRELKQCEKDRDEWLKKRRDLWFEAAGITLKTASGVIPLTISPLAGVAIPLLLLAVGLTSARKWVSKWREKEEVNSFHYFLDVKNLQF